MTRLMIDFDDTDQRLRIWQGAELVGEMKPNLRETPEAEVLAARWTGWLSSLAVVELFGSYSAETKRQAAVEGCENFWRVR